MICAQIASLLFLKLMPHTAKHSVNRLLRNLRARLFCFDNFQIGQELKDQRGGHSSAFFKGTNQCAHRLHEYEDTQWDEKVRVEITGLNNQPLPSPPGMARYEDAPSNRNLVGFMREHRSMSGDPEPDIGPRVDEYRRCVKHASVGARGGHCGPS